MGHPPTRRCVERSRKSYPVGMRITDGTVPTCQVARALDVIGEKWSLLIVRNALRGQTRFSEFRDHIGAPSDILAARLVTLVDAGILEKRPYREPGRRERFSYHLTESGEGLRLVVAALIQWGDTYNPDPAGPATRIVDRETTEGVSLAFVDAHGHRLDTRDIAIISTSASVAAT
jgi:DNA-binding HxlR family transcriptional regulator